ncbi:hypothetical protein ACFL35_00210 [Candidatus Riflebacteria bacterium]
MAKNWQQTTKKLGHKEKEQARREREQLEREEAEQAAKVKRNIIIACAAISGLIILGVIMFILKSSEKRAVESERASALAMKVLVAKGDVSIAEKAQFLALKKGDPLTAEKKYTIKTMSSGKAIIELADGGGKICIWPRSHITLGPLKKVGDRIQYYFEFKKGELGFAGIEKYPLVWKHRNWMVNVKQGEHKILTAKKKRRISFIGKSGHMLYTPKDKKIEETVIWQANKLTIDTKGRHKPIDQVEIKDYQWFH